MPPRMPSWQKYYEIVLLLPAGHEHQECSPQEKPDNAGRHRRIRVAQATPKFVRPAQQGQFFRLCEVLLKEAPELSPIHGYARFAGWLFDAYPQLSRKTAGRRAACSKPVSSRARKSRANLAHPKFAPNSGISFCKTWHNRRMWPGLWARDGIPPSSPKSNPRNKKHLRRLSAVSRLPAETSSSQMVRAKGLEPSWGCPHMDLNHARLPIPPRPRETRIYYDVVTLSRNRHE